jgi:3-deoxy-D-manno-octulosonic-acid transferase
VTSTDLSPRAPIARTGALLAGYLALTAALAPLGARHLQGRLAKGKEDPARWREKLGEAGAARPEGPLVWMHAVGLGEVLALRGLIGAMAAERPDLSFLVTSSALTSARAFAGQMPARTQHQFLPLDLPGPVTRYLAHWRPDLSIWAEQDLWPRAVVETAARGVPLALVNARMNDRAFTSRRRVGGLYRDLFRRFSLIAAQDPDTARHLTALGAGGVAVTGTLKAAAPPLAVEERELARMRGALAGRRVWLAASTHPGDEAVAIAAHAWLMERDPEAILILAPRDPGRAVAVPLPVARRSVGEVPGPGVYLADTIGEMGLWYRLAPVALIGGGFGIGGHNPWEAARLGCAVLHGPGVENFSQDYKDLHAEAAARLVTRADDLFAALDDPGLPAMAERGRALALSRANDLSRLAQVLCGMVR